MSSPRGAGNTKHRFGPQQRVERPKLTTVGLWARDKAGLGCAAANRLCLFAGRHNPFSDIHDMHFAAGTRPVNHIDGLMTGRLDGVGKR